MFSVEEDTKVTSMRTPHAVEYTKLISKQFHASTGCYMNKTFILYTIHRHKIHEQSIIAIISNLFSVDLTVTFIKQCKTSSPQ